MYYDNSRKELKRYVLCVGISVPPDGIWDRDQEDRFERTGSGWDPDMDKEDQDEIRKPDRTDPMRTEG